MIFLSSRGRKRPATNVAAMKVETPKSHGHPPSQGLHPHLPPPFAVPLILKLYFCRRKLGEIK